MHDAAAMRSGAMQVNTIRSFTPCHPLLGFISKDGALLQNMDMIPGLNLEDDIPTNMLVERQKTVLR